MMNSDIAISEEELQAALAAISEGRKQQAHKDALVNLQNEEICRKYIPFIQREPGYEARLEHRARQLAEMALKLRAKNTNRDCQIAIACNEPDDELLSRAKEAVLNDYGWVRAEYCDWMFGRRRGMAGVSPSSGPKSTLALLREY
ncbi:MAG: hypothetical protein K2X77_23650 [Candidatus Obscuribacterales bacterium]|nr:hypothetical protein [Candidatus Obscuribacterales bacterium]